MENVSELLQSLNQIRKESLEAVFDKALDVLKYDIAKNPFTKSFNMQCDTKYVDYFKMRLNEHPELKSEYIYSFTGTSYFKLNVPITFKIKEDEHEPETTTEEITTETQE